MTKRNQWLALLLAMPLLPVVGQARLAREVWERVSPWGDARDKYSLRRLGWGATNCGRVQSAHIPANRIEADACAVAAFQSDKPFRVRYDDPNDSCSIERMSDRRMNIVHCSGSVCESLLAPDTTVVLVAGRARLYSASATKSFRCP